MGALLFVPAVVAVWTLVRPESTAGFLFHSGTTRRRELSVRIVAALVLALWLTAAALVIYFAISPPQA